MTATRADQTARTSLADGARSLFAIPAFGPVLKLGVSYVVLVEIVLQVVFGRIDIPFLNISFLELGFGDSTIPREIFLGGAVIGSLYALIGMGLIVVYRANRIINFAQAQLGAVPAVAALLLITNKGWNYFAVLPVVVVGAVLLGAAVEKGPISRLRQAPRLILTVATIGIGFVLLVVEFFTKRWLSDDLIASATTTFPTPWSDFDFVIGTQTFNGNHVFALAVVAVVMSAIGAFFKFTDMGIAVRASAENADRASLLGIPVKRVSTVVWIIATVLSAIGVFLRAPLVGIPLTGFVGPAVLLFGLAAAVMAKMDSLPMCLASGMFIGCVDRTAVFATGQGSLATAAMLAVILVSLYLQRSTLSRAFDTGVSSFQATKEVRPVPNELRGLPEVKRFQRVTALLAALAILSAPFLAGDAQVGLVTQMVIFALVGVSLVVLTGWSGQISLGQWAFAGVGAVVAGGLVTRFQIDFFLVLILAGLAAACAAVLVGIPALRIQGLFLAVTTLAFAAFVEGFLLRRDYFGWLMPEEGRFVERPVLYGVFDLDTDQDVGPLTVSADAKFYYVCLVFLGLSMLVARSLRRNRSGRIFIGIRDNQRLMQAFGVHPAHTKLAAFAISGFLAGVGGGLFAYQQRGVEPDLFQSETSILVFVMAVIGGVGTVPGALLGAVFVKGIPLLPILRDIDLIDLLASGAGLLVLLLFMPGGLAEGLYRIRDNFLRRVAVKRGIFVPSLVADSLQAQEAADVLTAQLQTGNDTLVTATSTGDLIDATAGVSR